MCKLSWPKKARPGAVLVQAAGCRCKEYPCFAVFPTGAHQFSEALCCHAALCSAVLQVRRLRGAQQDRPHEPGHSGIAHRHCGEPQPAGAGGRGGAGRGGAGRAPSRCWGEGWAAGAAAEGRLASWVIRRARSSPRSSWVPWAPLAACSGSAGGAWLLGGGSGQHPHGCWGGADLGAGRRGWLVARFRL